MHCHNRRMQIIHKRCLYIWLIPSFSRSRSTNWSWGTWEWPETIREYVTYATSSVIGLSNSLWPRPTDKTDSVDWCNIEYPTETLKRKFGEIPYVQITYFSCFEKVYRTRQCDFVLIFSECRYHEELVKKYKMLFGMTGIGIFRMLDYVILIVCSNWIQYFGLIYRKLFE